MPLNINFQQIFLHFLNFTLLFAGLYFLLYKPVRAFMSKRDAYYADLDRQAQEKLAQAEELHHRYEEQIAGAQQQLLQAQTDASHIVASARAEAQAERERILREARSEISEMVTLAAGKLLSADTSAAYDQFLTEARRNGENG